MDNLQLGIDALKAGKRDEARNYLAAASKENPDDEFTWQWLYNACNTDKERFTCLQQILRINPHNEKAKTLQDQLTSLPGQSVPTPVAAISPAVVPTPVNAQPAVTPPLTPEQIAKNRKNLLYGVIGIILLCTICLISINLPSLSIPTGDPVKDLQTQVETKLGKSNRNVTKLSSFTFDAANSSILVNIAADDNLTENLINRGFMMDIEDTLQTIYKSNTSLPYQKVFIAITFPVSDNFGNVREAIMVSAIYSRSTLANVNWDNFITDNVYSIVDPGTLYLHPSVSP